MKINLPIPVQRRYDVSHHLRAVDTPVGFPAEKANSYWTVLGGLLLFNALQAYETDANNNRSRALGVRRCKDSDILFLEVRLL